MGGSLVGGLIIGGWAEIVMVTDGFEFRKGKSRVNALG